MTSDTCGPTSVTLLSPFARWSPSLKTWTDTGLLGLTLCLGTLPTWGCLRGGGLYELPTPERPTDASGSSSLLKTPHAGLGERGRDGVYANPKGQQDLQHQIATDLLPTPTVMDMGANYTPEEWEAWKAKQQAAHQNGNGHGASLTQEAISLLPTPKAGDGERGRDLPRMREDTKSRELATAAGSIGASTPPPSTAGSPSSDDPRQAPPSPAPTDDHDCLPYSWNG